MKCIISLIVLSFIFSCASTASREHYEEIRVYLDEIEVNNEKIEKIREKDSMNRVDSIKVEDLFSENNRLSNLANERSQFWQSQNPDRLVPNEYENDEYERDRGF